MEKEFLSFLNDYNVIYLEIYKSKVRVAKYGDIENLPYKGLYQELIGDENKIQNLFMSIKNDMRFQTWRQGSLVAMAIRCQTMWICMFYINEKKGIEGMEVSQKIYDKVSELDWCD